MKASLSVERSKGSTSLDKKKAVLVQRENLLKLLQQNFGHAEFRGRQLEAIEAVLAGRDCFCLMPTGGGKSVCYQIPALAKAGIVLVVSPLIALMENQVTTLKLQGISADFLSSTQNASVKSKILEDLDSGKPSLRLLYVTPELIATSSFSVKLKKLYERGLLNLIAIDEAHCISSWGHDFRPSYRQLSKLRASFSNVPILALTATAAKKVQEDIINSLRLHQPTILISSFNRPNIFYEVRYKDLVKSPYEDLRKLIKTDMHACAIIYCHARNTCDELGAQLQADGVICRVYHAGLADKIRSAALDDWASGRVPVIVGTVAFGMGIDRKDVRLVCHYNVPKSIESFYQESGRAGRDNNSSRSVLYYGLDDRRSMEYILRNAPKRSKNKLKESDVLLKKGIKDFEEMAAYCDSAGCRRQKVLSHFGEEVTTALCEKTCDHCYHPSQVSDTLQQLSEVTSTRGPGKCHVYVSSNDKGAGGFESEFWNFSDENEAEEDISSSDDEATEIAGEVIRRQRHMKRQLDSKLDSLLEAEREYNKRQGNTSEKSKDSDKKMVNQSLRDMAMQKLTKSLEQALKHNQTSSSSTKMMAEALEIDCFKKYGKSGRSFYNSQVASTLRWLSSCSIADLKARVPQEAFHTSEQAATDRMDSMAITMSLDPQLQAPHEILSTHKHNVNSASEMFKSASADRTARKISSEANVQIIQNTQTKRSSDIAQETSSEATHKHLPSIPSFHDFMSKRHKKN